jgi:hypothetical protein
MGEQLTVSADLERGANEREKLPQQHLIRRQDRAPDHLLQRLDRADRPKPVPAMKTACASYGNATGGSLSLHLPAELRASTIILSSR